MYDCSEFLERLIFSRRFSPWKKCLQQSQPSPFSPAASLQEFRSQAAHRQLRLTKEALLLPISTPSLSLSTTQLELKHPREGQLIFQPVPARSQAKSCSVTQSTPVTHSMQLRPRISTSPSRFLLTFTSVSRKCTRLATDGRILSQELPS